MNTRIFVNLSNHPFSKWSKEQLDAIDADVREEFPFPQVDPKASSEDVHALAKEYVRDIKGTYKDYDLTVHIVGEPNFIFAFVTEAKARGIRCVASTSERLVTENPDGTKTVKFEFQQFREY